jgi:hypothetical protein
MDRPDLQRVSSASLSLAASQWHVDGHVSDNDSRERFLREAKLASQLRHPYAAHVYAFGAEDQGSLLWIAMELVQGVSLHDWLGKHGPMSLEQFVPFLSAWLRWSTRRTSGDRTSRPEAVDHHGDRVWGASASQAPRLRDRQEGLLS